MASHISELCKKNDFDALCTYLVQSVTTQDLSEEEGDTTTTTTTLGGAKAAQDPTIVKNAGERLDDEGRTALHWAVAGGASQIALQLAGHPYHMNPVTVDVDKVTPLMSACSSGLGYDALYALLKSAEHNLQNKSAVVPGLVKDEEEEEVSAEKDDQPGAALGVDEQQKKEKEQTVGAASEVKKEFTLKEQVHAYVNMQDNLGNTALIAASSRGNSRLVTLLTSAEFGADAFVQNKRGQTALHRAVARGAVEAVEGLIQAAKGTLTTQSGVSRHRALLNTKDRQGNTALHYASMENNQELGEMLIRSGANRDAKNNDGKEFWQM